MVPRQTETQNMTTRSGAYINGKHFRQTINIAGRAQHFIDGKPVSGKVFRSEWALARAACVAAEQKIIRANRERAA